MSTFYQAFFDHAQTIPALTALVSTRVHAIKYPQSPVYPAIRFGRVGQPERDYTHDGDTGILISRYQVEVAHDETKAPSGDALTPILAIANLLTAKPIDGGFSGFTGQLGVAPNDLRIGVILIGPMSETYDADDLRVLRVIMDWRVQHCRES